MTKGKIIYKKKKMKYIILGIIILLIALGTTTYFVNKNKNKAGLFIISEKSFINDVNVLFNNYEEHIGDTIVVDGIFKKDVIDDITYYFLYRNTPGDNGNNGIAGIDLQFNNDITIPNDDSWCSVKGILKSDNYDSNEENSIIDLINSNNEDESNPYLYLDVIEIKENKKAGKRFVTE